MAEMGMAMMGTGEGSGADRAIAAAEGAIKCPLLEDVNLHGAKGILVNITSGYDLTLGEFEEVGNTIRAFSDDNATIIVGSVFDPEASDQLRVTVVATGLEFPTAKTGPRGIVAHDFQPIGGRPDYDSLGNEPAVKRRPASTRMGQLAQKVDATADPEHDFLDVPAFLRKQAD